MLSAGIEHATGCNNNAISWRGASGRKKNRRGCSAAESLKFSAEVARCRDTDCKRYRLSKFGETVSRRSGGVSEGNFHPPRLLLPGCRGIAVPFLHPSRETRDSGRQLSVRHSLHPNFISTESEAAPAKTLLSLSLRSIRQFHRQFNDA